MEFGSLWIQDLTPFHYEVEVRASNLLLCFYDLQVEPQYLSPGIYYLCYRVGLFSTWEAKRHERTLPCTGTCPTCPGKVCKVRVPPFLLTSSQGSDDLPAEYYRLLWPCISVTDLCGL